MSFFFYIEEITILSECPVIMEHGGEFRTSQAALICAANTSRYLSEMTDMLFMTRYLNVCYPHDIYQDMYGELDEI